ncbi:MAG: hypothetical protein K2M17_00545, partial [Bacilli bacterium]|nr:hypothetical protein [Bacilli bacterium]
DTVIQTVIGSDDYGEKIKKEFASVGVNTSYVETSYEKETSLSFILVNKKSGARTVFNVAGEQMPLKKYQYDFTPDIIYTDGHDYGAAQNAMTKFPNALRILDAGRPTQELLELCKYMTHIVCSKEFAETVGGVQINYENPNTLVQLYTKLKAKFPNANIVVTLEEKGALYVAENQVKIMPGLKVEAKDTTGAGDIFHGAFTYGLANNFDMEKTITFANIAAGLSVKTVGSRLSVPPLSEVLDYYTRKMTPTQTADGASNNGGGAPQQGVQGQVASQGNVAQQVPNSGATQGQAMTQNQGQTSTQNPAQAGQNNTVEQPPVANGQQNANNQ